MEEIRSRQNRLIVHMKKLGRDRSYRYENRKFLCEGEKLLREAAAHGAVIDILLTSREEIPGISKDIKAYKVTQDMINYVSPMKSPQDVVFSCAMPEMPEIKEDGKYIILERVQDPGNVGTVIRTASAFSFDSVILTEGCADVYNPKTVRATMGAVFRQNVCEMSFEEIAALHEKGLRLFGASLGEGSRDIRDVRRERFAAVIGSEGRGLSEKMMNICDKKIIIPMAPECESLNASAAAAIIMWEMSAHEKFCINK